MSDLTLTERFYLEFLSKTGPNTSIKLLLELELTEGTESSK